MALPAWRWSKKIPALTRLKVSRQNLGIHAGPIVLWAPALNDSAMRKLSIILLLMFVSLCAVVAVRAQAITINWGDGLQTIDGFGASSASINATLTSSQMDFFYTSSGIALDFIRIRIYPDFMDCSMNEAPDPCVEVSSGATLAKYDLVNAQAAAARGAQIIAAEWSPPGSMKSNGSFSGSGAFVGNDRNYSKLAAIQASFVTLLAGTYRLPLYAISPQNEPDVSQSYPSSTWTPQQIHDYIPYLTKALSAAGYSKTRIMIAEPGKWTNNYAAKTMNDANAASEVAILAAHSYNGSPSFLRYANITTQHQWQTEVSDFNAYDGSMKSALDYAIQIHHWLVTGRVNAWFYWELSAQSGYTDNEALTDVRGNVAKRAYAIGNWSRFVRPGWHMIAVTNGGRLLVTAFTNASATESAIVIVNNSASSANNQTFRVGTQLGPTVSAFVTSSTNSLALQNSIAIDNGVVKYTVPGNSIVTLTNVQGTLNTSALEITWP
jgi:O-glycosyl hydrolase